MSENTRTVLVDAHTESLHLRAFRLVVDDPGGAVEFACRGRRTVLGTRAPADVLLEDASVSRAHAAIEVDAQGYRLVDLGSKNGTWLDGRRVGSVYLRPGDTLVLGRLPVRFELTGEEVQVRISQRQHFGGLVGHSMVMREVFGLLERVAPTDLTVLVEGPSGTGKELVAEALHRHSPRHRGPFIVFDCSAVSRELIESELFGHVRGAFTGASSSRRGAFEEAQGGTLFLDELGELEPELQPKLLRVLERREVKRVGGNESVPVDVRIVAATNRSLAEEVRRGTFREDLYYRLAVMQVKLPALRERPEDVPLLVEHFLREAAERTGRRDLNVSWSTMERLKEYPWPGNVRELRNFVERAVVLAHASGEVDTRFLRPLAPVGAPDPGLEEDARQALRFAGVGLETPFKEAKQQLIDAFEREYWQRLLEHTEGNVSQAARIAGVHRKSLEYILRKLDMDRHDPAVR